MWGICTRPAKVEDQARLLARTLNDSRWSQTVRRLPAKQFLVEQLATLKTLVDQVTDNAFLAKLAVYSR